MLESLRRCQFDDTVDQASDLSNKRCDYSYLRFWVLKALWRVIRLFQNLGSLLSSYEELLGCQRPIWSCELWLIFHLKRSWGTLFFQNFLSKLWEIRVQLILDLLLFWSLFNHHEKWASFWNLCGPQAVEHLAKSDPARREWACNSWERMHRILNGWALLWKRRRDALCSFKSKVLQNGKLHQPAFRHRRELHLHKLDYLRRFLVRIYPYCCWCHFKTMVSQV